MNLIKKIALLLMSLNGFIWASEAAAAPESNSLVSSIDSFFGIIVGFVGDIMFFSVATFSHPIAGQGDIKFPFIIALLGFGGIFFTLRYSFVNVKLFKHAILVVMGKFDNPKDKGEISHFKALTSALSATVGLGNIAGVAVAISVGGAGAVFWMWIVAFLGMSMKLSSCTLAQLYRRVDNGGRLLGGPMIYLEQGLAEKGLKTLGKVLAVIFAGLTIMGSFGGGNMFQGNQTYVLVAERIYGTPENTPEVFKWIVGLALAIMVGAVILGGIKRIGSVTSKLIPAMVVFYSGVCLTIIFSNFSAIPVMFGDIFSQAFSPEAAFGGFIGVLIQGMKRASFSNEAGLGSAAIIHAAAKTKEPVREGTVAMLGPFIDTIVVCTMTALTLLITQSHTIEGLSGVELTSHAFGTLHPFLPTLLTIAVVIFAYSTMISWSYYGEKATEYLFGESFIKYYRIVFSVLVVLGPVMSIGNVLEFSDLMLLSMAFPNIIGMIILSGKVKGLVTDYYSRLKNGEIVTYK